MTESEFIASVDCALPYADGQACRELIRTASGISPNACFMIGEELARPPRSVVAPIAVRLQVLAALRKAFDHPLRDKVLDVAELLIRGTGIGRDHALELLSAVALHKNQYCAGNIVYFACADDPNDILDAEWNRIRAQWAAA